MSDNSEDEFEDTVEGPFDGNVEKAELKKFKDKDDKESVLREAQEQEERALQEDIIDDSHERSFEEAAKAKAEGNEYFRNKNYDDAAEMYSKAIYFCPLGEEHKEQMSIFYGNRSACYVHMRDHELVIADCTSALDLNCNYTKVLMRRCQAFEALEKYDEALADIKKLLEIDDSYPAARSTLSKLEKLHAEKFEKMKDEALGKLKDLGNSILGNFGMSLDNFKMEQDPNTGSWSINMKS